MDLRNHAPRSDGLPANTTWQSNTESDANRTIPTKNNQLASAVGLNATATAPKQRHSPPTYHGKDRGITLFSFVACTPRSCVKIHADYRERYAPSARTMIIGEDFCCALRK